MKYIILDNLGYAPILFRTEFRRKSSCLSICASVLDLATVIRELLMYLILCVWLCCFFDPCCSRGSSAVDRGREWNPLRQRLDSFDYTVRQHIVGSLLFTPLLLLFSILSSPFWAQPLLLLVYWLKSQYPWFITHHILKFSFGWWDGEDVPLGQVLRLPLVRMILWSLHVMTEPVLHLKSHILRMIGAKIDRALWSPSSTATLWVQVSPHSIFHLIVLLSPDAWAATGLILRIELSSRWTK
jgi:hypothetical protein